MEKTDQYKVAQALNGVCWKVCKREVIWKQICRSQNSAAHKIYFYFAVYISNFTKELQGLEVQTKVFSIA